MKRFILSLITLSLLAIGSQAQVLTPINTNTVTATGELPKTTMGISSVIRFDENAQAATNWTFAISPLYAPDLKDRNGNYQRYGVGIAALYPVSQYAYVGFSMDYIGGDFLAGNVGCTLKADLKLFGHLSVTPFVETKVAYAFQNGGEVGGDPIGVVGTGALVNIWQGKSFGVGAMFVIEKWAGYGGAVYRPGVTLNYKF